MSVIVTSRTRTRQPSGPVGINWANPLARGLRILDYGLLDNRAADSRLQSVTADGATRAGTSGGVARRGTLGKLFTWFDLSTTGAATFFSVSRFVSAEANAQSVIFKSGGGNGMTGLGIHGGSNKLRLYRAAGNTTSFAADVVVGAASLYEFAAQAVTIDSTGNVLAYLDGAIVATGSITGGLVTRVDLPFATMRDGYTGTGALGVSVDLLIGTVHDRAMSPGEVCELSRNPWQLFAPVRRPVYFFGPSAGAGTTVSVPVGAISVAGYAPTVTATAHQTISVPAGSVTLNGYAPTVSTSASQTIAVPAGAVTLAGYAPTVTATANQSIAVPVGAVSLSGYAPSVFTTAVTTISVPAGAVSLAGFAPTISYTTHKYIDVPKGAVTLTGYAPTVTGGESSIWTPVTTDSAVWSAQSVSAATWTPQ